MFSELTDQVRRVREQLDSFERALPSVGGFGEGPEWVAGGLCAEMKRLLTMLGQPPPPKPPKLAYFRKKKAA